MRISPLPVVIAFILGLAIVLALILNDRMDDHTYETVKTTTDPTPATTWLESQPSLGERFPDYLAGVERAKRAHRLKRKPAAPRVMRGEWPWDAVKECESPGLGWDANTGNGFEGGLQFHPQTWAAYNLPGYPPRAYMATREQQIAVAERVLAEQGWRAWPTCSRKLGLR